jgi:hypothetical protein
MKLLRAVLRSPKGRFLIAALVCYLGWQLWLTYAAPAKIAPGLTAGSDKVNILVTLPFPPERFHVLALQRFGRVSGTEGNSIEVRSVKSTELTAVARPYWVTRVEPLRGG